MDAFVSKPSHVPLEDLHLVLFRNESFLAATKDQRDWKNGKLVPRTQQGTILVHPRPKVPVRSQLDFDVDQNELRVSIAGFELGDDIGFAGRSLGTVRENSWVEKLQALEI